MELVFIVLVVVLLIISTAIVVVKPNKYKYTGRADENFWSVDEKIKVEYGAAEHGAKTVQIVNPLAQYYQMQKANLLEQYTHAERIKATRKIRKVGEKIIYKRQTIKSRDNFNFTFKPSYVIV